MHDDYPEGRHTRRDADIESIVALSQRTRASLACLIHPFIRVDFGRRYLANFSMPGIALLWIYSVFMPPHDRMPCIVFSIAFIAGASCHRFRHYFFGSGKFEISNYNGFPRVCLKGTISEDQGKLYVEPVVVGGLGFLILCFFSKSLGIFLLICTAASAFEHLSYLRTLTRRAQDLRDAELEQDILLNKYDEEFPSRF